MNGADVKQPPDHIDGLDLPIPTLENMQHWTRIIGQAQQLILEFSARQMAKAEPDKAAPAYSPPVDPEAAGKILVPMLLSCAFAEAIAIYALVIALIIFFV